MSAAPTLKELVKAVGTFSRTPSLPLPDDLIELIENFLYNRADKLDGNTSDKVHDELLSIFKNDIAHEPKRYAAFLAVLRRLRPLIGQREKVLQWFELLVPVLNHLSQERDLAVESQGVVLDILVSGDEDDPSSFAEGAAAPIADKLMLLWIDEVETLRKDPDVLQEFKEQHTRETLLLFGKKRPRAFLGVIDKFVCQRLHRANALTMLSAFVQSQPPHLYWILETPLFGDLLTCLQKDTSTLVISLALTALTMVLPHVPKSVVPHLPALFNIYARLLFWERELSGHYPVEHGLGTAAPSDLPGDPPGWEMCTFSPPVDERTVPQLGRYFTILYGLYPINFMDYIRKPVRYLRHAYVPDADAIEVQPSEIRHASERFRQSHLLHENFYTLTIDTEKTDFGRWIKSEPAEVVADCMALHRPVDEDETGVPPELESMFGSDGEVSDAESAHSALLSCSVNIGTAGMSPFQEDVQRSPGSSNSQLISGTAGTKASSPTTARLTPQSSNPSNVDATTIRLSDNENDSPILSRKPTSISQTRLQDLMKSTKTVKSALHQSLTNDSVHSLSSSHHEPSTEGLSEPPVNSTLLSSSPTTTDQHAKLLRYVCLLYNDLLFERFMKQQHLIHIGVLKRRKVREVAGEAETQNILRANKHLKQRLDEAKKSEVQVKTEAEKSRTLSKKWEADLVNKLRILREEQKKWNATKSSLESELQLAKVEVEQLRNLVCEGEVRELKLKQNMQSAETSSGNVDRLKAEIERLTEVERNYQAKELEYQAAMTRASEAESRTEAAMMKLAACETEHNKSISHYRSKVEWLERDSNWTTKPADEDK
ncbi:hypothetical protein GGS20DRAFT_530947 [Poronia punctata]|nr:hypothetical protein GGS20DRAFT_530947 [Poronia punctata]